MEEKKLDINSIIGFVLIFGILIFMFYQNKPTPEELEAQKAQTGAGRCCGPGSNVPENQIVDESTPNVDLKRFYSVASYKSQIGAFGFTAP